MKNTNAKHRKISSVFIAFLAVALIFLAVGLGTLGSFTTTGDSYELRVAQEDSTNTPSVVFRLEPTVQVVEKEDGKQTLRTVNLRIRDVLVNVSALYSEPGTPSGIAIERSSSEDKYFSNKISATLENFYTAETVDENGESTTAAPSATDVLYNWVSPFAIPESGWRLSTYKYIRLTATTHNIRIGEVLFVGEDINDPAGEENTRYVIPATIVSATPAIGETSTHAVAAASALLDSKINQQALKYSKATKAEEKAKIGMPELPTQPVSSYYTFSKSELHTVLTLTEMRAGNGYTTDSTGNVLNVYNGDKVYGSLGIDLVAFGTVLFGLNPFGVRFMPMLAAFGVLVLGYFFVKQLTKSEKAGLVFAILYALSCLTFALGHLGTPLMIGVFFYMLSLFLCYRFYAYGMKKANFAGVVPMLFSGLAAAAAICVNGAFVIPVIGIVALYVAGMVRQQTARRYYLDAAIAEAEAEENSEESVSAEEKGAGRKKVVKVLADYRYKNIAMGVVFPAALILGIVLFSFLCILPVYFILLRLYGNAPTLNVFTLTWKVFAGGFVGANVGQTSAWSLFYVLFEGTGTAHAVTAAVLNPVALLAGALGFGYAVYRLVMLLTTKEGGKTRRSELRRIVILLAVFVLSMIAALAVKTAGAFVLLFFLSSFLLAANCFGGSYEGKTAKVFKIVNIVGAVLLALAFIALAVFTFSVPLPATFLASILG